MTRLWGSVDRVYWVFWVCGTVVVWFCCTLGVGQEVRQEVRQEVGQIVRHVVRQVVRQVIRQVVRQVIRQVVSVRVFRLDVQRW